MLGKIKNIVVVHNIEIKPGYSMDGYKVETDKHTFYVLIDNDQSCCETWGYLSSDDDLNYFIGANLLQIKVIDKALNQKDLIEKNYDIFLDEGNIQFVDFKTSTRNHDS